MTHTDNANIAHQYWQAFASAFAQPLQANSLVGKFVTNGNVTGLYAENWIRETARKMLGQRFRISTGAVIRSTDAVRGLNNIPQCDMIIWDPSELPALFESGDFALVPFHSVRAVIEIKRSMSNPGELLKQLQDRSRVAPLGRVLGVVISHPARLFDQETKPDWLEKRAVGADPPMTRLLDGDNQADTDGVFTFIYFLAQLAGHTREGAS